MTESDKKQFTPIVQRDDRELVQSFAFTFSKQNLNVWEKRILYHIVYDTKVQDYVREKITEGKKKNDKMILFTGTTSYKLPLNRISSDSGDYKRIKNAFSELSTKGFEFTDEKGVWKKRTFIAFPTIDPYEGCAYFVVHNDLLDIIGDIRNGYRQFNFFVAISLESAYAMRFYEMFSRQDANGNPKTNGYLKRDIEELKEILGLTGKYEKNIMFVKRIIEPAKKELDEKANFSFDYKLEKSFGSRKTDIIQFHIYHIPENETKNDELLENKAKAELTPYIRVSKRLWNTLIEIGFSDHEIKSNQYTLYIAENFVFLKRARGDKEKATYLLIQDIDRLKELGLKKPDRNFKPYIMGTLQKICEIDYKEHKEEKIKAFAERVALQNANKEQNEPQSEPIKDETPFSKDHLDNNRATSDGDFEDQPTPVEKMGLDNLKNILADQFNSKK